jgi:excisionase family DNA binding protein
MHRRRPDEGDRALVVSPSRAAQILDCGEARLYQLLKDGSLRSYKDGKSRKILVASIHAFVKKKLAEASAGLAA